MGQTALVPVASKPASEFVHRLQHEWSLGHAVLPYDPAAPAAEVKALLDRMRPADPIDELVRLVVATSGTSGAPKGAMIAMSALESSASAAAARLQTGPEDRWLSCLPLHHIAGLSTVVRTLISGLEPVVHEGFDPRAVADEDRASLISLVPAMASRLLEERIDFSKFRAVLLGGGPIPSSLVERMKERGATVVRTYGMTETCGGCVFEGIPLDGVEVKIENEEILVRGPVLLEGYRQAHEPVFEDGWFRTRDRGVMRGGVLEVLGRSDNVIVTGGEKVSPEEVERALCDHPEIREALVFGRPDDTWGSVVGAAVVARRSLPLAELHEFLEAHISQHKWPRELVLVERLPRSPAGKLDRTWAP